jgi:hypothetical protein
VTPNKEKLALIDARALGGHLDKIIQRFAKCSPKFQDRLVDSFLAKCVEADRGTMLHECSGYELRLHVERETRTVALLTLTLPHPLH